MKQQKYLSCLLSALLALSTLSACNFQAGIKIGQESGQVASNGEASNSGTEDGGNGAAAADTSARTGEQAGSKKFVFGDTTFNPENEESDVNPHNAYSGWACIRYGIGETLFRYGKDMQIEPWLAASYELLDELSWQITIKDNINFSNGNKLDAQAVKACLEALVSVHKRAAGNLIIADITAQGQDLIIKTQSPNPTLINYLCDPYSCIVDVTADNKISGAVTGTGPYVVESLESGKSLLLSKNKDYWQKQPYFDEIKILNITDGDTLSLALQSGEIDAAYGLPYASYPLFSNDDYAFSGTATSRAFFLDMNFKSPIIKEAAVRQAIAMGIDKESYVEKILAGNAFVAAGPFPENFAFGGSRVKAKTYNPEQAKKVLEEAGWIDSDGDGIREKNGQKLKLRWLTYPSRQELPLLAEAAQATLKDIGIDTELIITPNHNAIREDKEAWDIYANAMITAPTGDPAYFFASRVLEASAYNHGSYFNADLEKAAQELQSTFDVKKRNELAIKMQELLLADDAFVFCAHLKMNLVFKSHITGLEAHSSDYYELTADLAEKSS